MNIKTIRLSVIACGLTLGLSVSGLVSCGFTNYKNASAAPSSSASTGGVSGTAPITQTAPTNMSVPTTPGTALSPTSSATPTAATFSQVNSQILQPKCLGCHGAGGSPDFSSYAAFATNSAFVVPGNPQGSAFYTAVNSGSMPKGGQPLTQDEITLIYDWIQNGAKND